MTEYTVEEKTIPVYRVEFRGKAKILKMKSAIPGWVAKQAMLPIFYKYHEKFGEVTENLDGSDTLHNVFSEWRYCKTKFIENMQHGLNYAEAELIRFFENDFF